MWKKFILNKFFEIKLIFLHFILLYFRVKVLSVRTFISLCCMYFYSIKQERFFSHQNDFIFYCVQFFPFQPSHDRVKNWMFKHQTLYWKLLFLLYVPFCWVFMWNHNNICENIKFSCRIFIFHLQKRIFLPLLFSSFFLCP